MRFKLLVLVVLIVTLLATGVAFAGAPVHHVSGGGTVYFEGLGNESYGFVAHIDENGDVRGQGEFHFVNPLVNFHADMNCLVVDRDTAWLGMIVTKTDNPLIDVGTDWTWQVQDNGEGKFAPPDLQSYIVPTDFLAILFPDTLPDDCSDMPDIFSYGEVEWTNGNIQIDQNK